MSSDKPSILIQLDTDAQPSVFDAVVAVDAGVDRLFRHGQVRPESVRDLVHGALFTRGPADLHRTAIFVGGSDVAQGEAVLEAIRATFFGDFRVSFLFDANGCNTTAAAAALAVVKEVEALPDPLHETRISVLGATGPVGQRVARLLARLGARVSVGSRQLERAQATADRLSAPIGCTITPFATAEPESLRAGLAGQQVVVAAGAAGVTLLAEDVRRSLSDLRVAIDLNAVPPAGIAGVLATDKRTERDGLRCWGAIGIGGMKMKIHKKAIQELFTANNRILDAEEVLEIGRKLG